MPSLQNMTPEQFVGAYGPGPFRWGVISEHLDSFMARGGEVRTAVSGSGAQFAMVGRQAYPVLCSEMIQVRDEDGLHSGRCGATAYHGFCEGHREVRDAYLAMDESERVALEKTESWDDYSRV